MGALLVVVAVAAVLVVLGIATFNGLVSARNALKNGFNQIDVQLKRRHDLIPNLVASAQGYMNHERQTLESVTKARQMAVGAATPSDKIAQEQGLSQALGRLLSISENYPELKANSNFQSLQEELASTENRIAFARQHYNDSVMAYDTKRQGFPGVLLAGGGRFADEPYWKIDESTERTAPVVKF